MMISRSEGYFRGYNDYELFFQAWNREDSQGTLVVTHGLGEHTESYHRLVRGLENLPLDIFVWDLRGHGRSEGKRGVVRNFADYCEDFNCFLNYLRRHLGDVPLYSLSHSMGGLVTSLALLEKGDMGLKGMVMSSPLMGIQIDIPKVKKIGATYMARWAPQFTMFNEIYNFQLTQEKEIIEEFEKDPLRHDRISSQLFLDMIKYSQFVRDNAGKIKIKTLIQQSGKDTVVSQKYTEEFFNNLGSEDKKFIIYENSHHEIYNDIEREKVFKDLNHWFEGVLK